MQLSTTFRGLSRAESASATSALERSMTRIDRLLERPAQVRAVVEGRPPEHRVSLMMSVEGEDLNAQSTGHDLTTSINTACERLRSQLLRRRRRRESKQKSNPPLPVTS